MTDQRRSDWTTPRYTISVVAERYDIHPQTLRLYEREGLLQPSRTEGNTRLYSDADLEQLETILSLTRDLGVNLAGVEIILHMRSRMERMHGEVQEMLEYLFRYFGERSRSGRGEQGLLPRSIGEALRRYREISAEEGERDETGAKHG